MNAACGVVSMGIWVFFLVECSEEATDVVGGLSPAGEVSAEELKILVSKMITHL